MDDNLELKFQDIMDFVADAGHGHEDAAAAASHEAVPGERRSGDMIEFDEEALPAVIKVVGIGGGGSNAVSSMVLADIKGVQFIVVNTDLQALGRSPVATKLQIGAKTTRGRGSGANPEVGRNAALEDTERIKSLLSGADMVFITAGMGGGTGTGAAPVIAGIAREAGALSVGVVTKPFAFEGESKMRKAEEGIAELRKNVDALIVIPNERLINLAEKRTTLLESFREADGVLCRAVKGISDVVLVPGHVNVDFADVKTVMANRGRAVMGSGVGRGESRAQDAAHQAISSPLLEDGSIKGALGVLINITGGSDLGMNEVKAATDIIKQEVDPSANIIFGAVISPSMSEEVTITVIATGFDDARMRVKVNRPLTSLKEFKSSLEKPKRKQEAFDFKNESLGIGHEDLDKPTFLRRQAD